MPSRFFWFSLALFLGFTAVMLAGCGGAGSAPGSSLALAASAPGPKLHGPIRVQGVTAAQVSGLSPKQIRHAYGFDTLSTTGAGQTIAIEDSCGSPHIQSDLNVFCKQFGLPTTTIQIVYPAGKPSSYDPYGPSWASETSLDVEWAHAIAPGAKLLLAVDNDAQSLSPGLACIDYAAAHAAQVSISWGYGEWNGQTSYDFHFNKPGVTFCAATGDSGGAATWPATNPNVVAVGGTHLSVDSAGNRLGESAWQDSSGGRSRFESEPYWQQGWQSSGWREAPDVSADAALTPGVALYDSVPDEGYVGWQTVGGTSVATPLWAALFALANSLRASHLNGAPPALYTLGNPSQLSSYFFDITTGANRRYSTTYGYDLVTGLGTPRASALVRALAAAY